MSLVERYARLPQEIESESFAKIDALLQGMPFAGSDAQIVKRMVHAVGDATIVGDIRIHPQFASRAVSALQRGATVYTDVAMVAAGVSQDLLRRLQCRVVCAMELPNLTDKARQQGVTRAVAAFRELERALDGSLVAVGNAPTALLALIDLMEDSGVKPEAVIGVPVGFVAAAEAKAELVRRDVPYLTLLGTRGGSTLAVAVVNALLRLALGMGNV